ncbi:MAG: hypothetical protein QXV32_05550 [Conexivisphaerales archaeon]
MDFLKADLPRIESTYQRLTSMIKEAEDDYNWMIKRIEELEDDNRRLRESLSLSKKS